MVKVGDETYDARDSKRRLRGRETDGVDRSQRKPAVRKPAATEITNEEVVIPVSKVETTHTPSVVNELSHWQIDFLSEKYLDSFNVISTVIVTPPVESCKWTVVESHAYYNALRITSEKPSELIAKSLIADGCAWEEFKSEDGRRFYCDLNSVSYTKPQALEEFEDAKKLLRLPCFTWDEGILKYYTDGTERQWEQPPEHLMYEKARSSFSHLLEEFEVTSCMPWCEIEKLCSADRRWKLLGDELRRSTVVDYQLKLQETEDLHRKQDAEATFLDILRTEYYLNGNTRWPDVRDMIEAHPKCNAMIAEDRKENIFNEFTLGLRNAEREEQERKQAPARKSFAELIKRVSNDEITIDPWSSWRDVAAPLAQYTACNTVLSSLSLAERKHIFQMHLQDLRTERKVDYARYLFEKKRRQENIEGMKKHYAKCLQDYVAAGTIDADTQWDDFQEIILEDHLCLELGMEELEVVVQGLFLMLIKDLKEEKIRIATIDTKTIDNDVPSAREVSPPPQLASKESFKETEIVEVQEEDLLNVSVEIPSSESKGRSKEEPENIDKSVCANIEEVSGEKSSKNRNVKGKLARTYRKKWDSSYGSDDDGGDKGAVTVRKFRPKSSMREVSMRCINRQNIAGVIVGHLVPRVLI